MEILECFVFVGIVVVVVAAVLTPRHPKHPVAVRRWNEAST